VLSTGGCADNCVGKWTYQQFAYFPITEGSGTEKWTHQLELRFSQDEDVGFGVRNTKFLKVFLRDRNYHEIDSLFINIRAGYVYASIHWSRRSVQVTGRADLEGVEPQKFWWANADGFDPAAGNKRYRKPRPMMKLDPSQKVYVCTHVFDGSQPVTLVSRPDGDWCFLCGGEHEDDASSYRVVGIGHLFDTDPTIQNLSDLEPNWEAERKRPGQTWLRTRCEPNN